MLAPRRSFSSVFVAAVACLTGSAASAAPVYVTYDLHGGPLGSSPTPFISVYRGPSDVDGDGWYDSVFKINLRDPAIGNPFKYAQFRISYDAAPTGLSVNIGDSSTNDGGSGDGATQSNDAELQIGSLLGDVANYSRLQLLGNDLTPPAAKVQAEVAGLVTGPGELFLTIGNEMAAWDNGAGYSGNASSPYLFALDGQADSEGPINYDIYAAFNGVVAGGRYGTGVGQVTICLSEDASCFSAVPLPGSMPLALLGLGVMGIMRMPRHRNQ